MNSVHIQIPYQLNEKRHKDLARKLAKTKFNLNDALSNRLFKL